MLLFWSSENNNMGYEKIMNKKSRAAVSAGMFQPSNMTTHRSSQPKNRPSSVQLEGAGVLG